MFVIHPNLDTTGAWELEAEFTSADGLAVTAKSAFAVKEASATPAIGAPAPASITARASDVPDLSHITTDPSPDPALYALSLHEALAEDKPLVVLFATPAYCVTATCGPLVEDLTAISEQFGDQANFVHVEVYRDPHRFESGQRPGRGRRCGRRQRMGAADRAVDLRGRPSRDSTRQVRVLRPSRHD